MRVLAIETATEACSAALYISGEIRLRYQVEPRRHSELILPMMDALLAEAEIALSALDALAFGCGPGSFTGVRIATGVVQGAAFGADLPVVPVSTLAALAQRRYREQGEKHLLPAYDARMDELYWGCYRIGDDGLAHPLNDDLLLRLIRSTCRPGRAGWELVQAGPVTAPRCAIGLVPAWPHLTAHCYAAPGMLPCSAPPVLTPARQCPRNRHCRFICAIKWLKRRVLGPRTQFFLHRTQRHAGANISAKIG